MAHRRWRHRRTNRERADSNSLIVSFSGAGYLRFPPPSLSLRWYQRFFGVSAWRKAIGVSVRVASLTMIFATVLACLGPARCCGGGGERAGHDPRRALEAPGKGKDPEKVIR